MLMNAVTGMNVLVWAMMMVAAANAVMLEQCCNQSQIPLLQQQLASTASSP
jgi:hypothetical protein